MSRLSRPMRKVWLHTLTLRSSTTQIPSETHVFFALKRGYSFKRTSRGVRATRVKANIAYDQQHKYLSPAELKALKNRIVLSNTNAVEVKSLKSFDERVIRTDGPKEKGQVLALPYNVIDHLRAIHAFKRTQLWNLYGRPAVLVTEETLEIAKVIDRVSNGRQETARKIIVGDRSCGKSVLLLQALTMAILKGWTVIHLPNVQSIVNATTDYAPIAGTTPTQYVQKDAIAILLSQIRSVNAVTLRELKVTQQHDLPITPSDRTTLDQLVEPGLRSPELAWPCFLALWSELTAPSRPPILMAVDDLPHIMTDSQYLSQDLKRIHAHDLALINHLIRYLSGASAMPNGGMIIAAFTKSNAPNLPSLDYAIERARLQGRGTPEDKIPPPNPYKRNDMRVIDSLKGVELIDVKGISQGEARRILEYYASTGLLHRVVDDDFVAEKWAMAGGGNIGELERAVADMTV